LSYRACSCGSAALPRQNRKSTAFCDRLSEIGAGGRLKLVQIYTVARPPAESFVTPLNKQELEAIAARVRARGITAEVFEG
jgi:hypothetical protein